jgi:SpoIID/LytB domain protein
MSQWGAQAMAESGAGYREILETFYPGTELREGAVR